MKTEAVTKSAVRKYVRWALFDADLHCHSPRVMPVHTIYAQKTGESTIKALGKLNKRLQKLAKVYLDAAGLSQNYEHAFPVLYGFFLCGPIVALLTMDSDPNKAAGMKEGARSRFVSQFDLSERGQDVWNSLAIAIMTMYIRKTMMKVKEEVKGGLWKFIDSAPMDMDEDL